MDNKYIYLNSENKRNRIIQKHSYSSTMKNLMHKKPKRNITSLDYSKLKFNQNILINLLKKTNLKKFRHCSHSKLNYIPFNKKELQFDFKTSYNLNRKFHDLPIISKFHNITNEKINELIKSDNNCKSVKVNFINNIQTNINDISTRKKYNNTFRHQANNNRLNNLKNGSQSLTKKKLIASLGELNSNYTNDSISIKNKNLYKNKNKLNTNLNKNTNINTQANETTTESNKDGDLYRRGSIVDRLVFIIEKPEECFEENLTDEKPSDKYQMFKNQIVKHKEKIDKIIKEIKKNQIKSEYLMKKYIFDLMSRKKKVY
jgi:hypothetical protein